MKLVALTEPKPILSMMLSENDFVTAVVINELGETLILEGGRSQSGVLAWQVIGRNLLSEENPIKAVQDELRQYIGHHEGYWIYLGSYENCHDRVGHLFCVKDVPHAEPKTISSLQPKWVPLPDLRLALLDGRFSDIRVAANVALALFLLTPAPIAP